MPIDTFLKSLPEDSTRHVQPDIEFLAVAPCPFLEDDQVGYQIERLSGVASHIKWFCFI